MLWVARNSLVEEAFKELSELAMEKEDTGAIIHENTPIGSVLLGMLQFVTAEWGKNLYNWIGR
jgi:hypothetical protein